MKVMVVGCGKIGRTILKNLANEGHDVIAVDNNRAVTADIANKYDVMCACGSGTDYETLSEAGVASTELFIAVTNSDEINMLSCYIAKKMGAKHTVARIRKPEFNDKNLGFMKQQLDISLIINPELVAAQELFNILKLPSAVNIETFSRRNFEMIEIILKDDSVLNGVALKDIRKKFNSKFLICAVRRDEKTYIPDGDFILKSGDKIGITAATTQIQKLLKEFGILKRQARNVMILGASRIAYYLAKFLIESGNNVKIIDMDRKRCEDFANSLPEATIIHGDGAEQDVLLEEGLESCDAFVALTGMDEENILVSYFASSLNVPTAIPKINKSTLFNMAEKLGLDTVITPRHIIAGVVLRYARALESSLGSNIETLYKLMGKQTEAIEFKVSDDFLYAGIPLKQLKLKKNILIGGIIRGRKAIIPDGEDAIMPNDKVIVIVSDRKLTNLADIME